MDIAKHNSTKSFNPIVAIGIAIGVATIMVGVTFTVFINSSAYKTVKQIQVGTKLARSIKPEGYDSTAPIKASDVEAYSQRLNNKVNSYNNQLDFGPANISDSALGL